MSFTILDLDKIVSDFFKKRVPNEAKKYCDLKEPRIDWEGVLITYAEPVFLKHGAPTTPTASILFISSFNNTTPDPQTFALNSVRVTKSTCETSLNKTFSFGGSIGVVAELPVKGFTGRAKFFFDRTKQKGNTNTSEQELTWGINSDIVVPPVCTTTAELKIKEEDLSGEFEMESTFDGRVYVDYLHEKEKDVVHSDSEEVSVIFKDVTGFFPTRDGAPKYSVTGTCKCRIGVEQMVTVTEETLKEIPFGLRPNLVVPVDYLADYPPN
ncbi:unnamed protein product [Lymnaea stagnalis]|uniref:Uncharacterized protein n=1 Tax=Lymnaea stagnalis TaxID=6523 RepID=A0AAV2IDM7_LYMST